MWRMPPRLAITTLTATMALVLSTAPKADAASVRSFSYTTTGSISGMSGVQPISFYSLFGNGTLSFAAPFALGEFITNPLPATATLTYDHTPFVIDLNVVTAPGSPIANYDYKVAGVLNGSITGAGHSDMFAYITSITGNDFGTNATPPFPVSELQIVAPRMINAPLGGSSGFSRLDAQLVSAIPNPIPAPEPTSIVVFGSALGAWVLRRRSRSKAKA